MKAELRAWRELNSFDLGPDYSNLAEFRRKAQKIRDKVTANAWFLVQRNGRITSIALDPVTLVSQACKRPEYNGFSKFHVLCLHDVEREKFDARETRLLKAFHLDALLSIPLLSSTKEHLLLASLKIENRDLLMEVDVESLSSIQWQEKLKQRWFGLREESLNFRKFDIHTDQQKPRSLMMCLEVRSKNHKWHGSDRDEFVALAKTLNMSCEQFLEQKLDKPHPGTFIGSGKYAELIDTLNSQDFTHLLFNCDVPASLKRKITQETYMLVWDRTDLVLQIFLQHAGSEKAKLQVELARLEYHGDEEIRTAVENFDFDKGYDTYEQNYRLNIAKQKRDIINALKRCHQQEKTRQEMRSVTRPLSLSLIGYTNAGKSSLFNALFGSEVVGAANVLFKTLETTTRNINLNAHTQLVITDTVGFLKNMPKHLYEAFHSTLAEANLSTHLLILLDPVGVKIADQIDCIVESLTQIGRTDRDNWIFVLNKMDLLTKEQVNEILDQHQIPIAISCIQAESILSLKEELLLRISKTMLEASLVLSHADYSKIHQMKGIASLKQEPIYLPEGIQIELQYREEQKFRLEQVLGYPLP